MSDDPRSVRNTPLRIDPERLAHALARADLKARLFGPPSESERVGRFAVLRRVGAGGMGVVFAAYDEQLDRRIALKLVHPGHHDPAAAARSKREAQALARLSHPNVVQVYEVGEARGHVYIAMEFVQGETLRAWQQRAPRSWRETLAMYVQAGRGLAAAHAVGLVHRDFKPENVLVGDDGRPRVVDFGLARARPPDGAENRSEGAGPKEQVRMGMTPRAGLRVEAAELTAPGAVVGTPAYMAPEQHAGGEADARSDVFCFCVALHEALHGARPFAGERREDVHAAIVAGAIARGPREVPAWLQRVVDRGLQADPAARWPSMDALLTALGRDPTRVRRQLALALALLAALAGGGAWAWQRLEQRHAQDVEEQRARTAATAADLERTQAAEEARRLAAAAGQHADPALRLLLAVAAVSTARERGEAPPLEVEQALLDALDGPRSELFARPGAAVVDALTESGDGRWLATGEREGRWRCGRRRRRGPRSTWLSGQAASAAWRSRRTGWRWRSRAPAVRRASTRWRRSESWKHLSVGTCHRPTRATWRGAPAGRWCCATGRACTCCARSSRRRRSASRQPSCAARCGAPTARRC
ncbi:serine/threonine-protein kinase [Nannocystis pusilla]|uniref:serine/threonine-protein kinase n=1 Tax=Nannocystis pusilla TaxID=889268 RepID=UPI003B7FF15F